MPWLLRSGHLGTGIRNVSGTSACESGPGQVFDATLAFRCVARKTFEYRFSVVLQHEAVQF